MLMLAALAALMAPLPTPTPQSALAPLRTIASVRATPYCSALRHNVAPAIAGVIESDRAIDASDPIFRAMYQHGTIEHSESMEFDIIQMESLITPLVKAQRAIDNALADKAVFVKSPKTDDDRKLLEIKRELEAVQSNQKAALNVISGLVATYQLGEMQEQDTPIGAQDSMRAVPNAQGPLSASPTAAATLLNAGVAPGAIGRLPSEDPANYGPFQDPFAPLHSAIGWLRRDGDAKETVASKTILTAVEQCRP